MSTFKCCIFLVIGAAFTLFSQDKDARKPTGYFHSLKENGKWWLIDPYGNKFISKGASAVRISQNRNQDPKFPSYSDTCLKKYGSEDAWRNATSKRLVGWGFNTLGSSGDARFSTIDIDGKHLAYTTELSMGSRFVSVKTKTSAWTHGAFPDVFDPEFEKFSQQMAQERCAPQKNDPWLLGWFIDNELHWGPDWRGNDELLTMFLAMPDSAPGRAAAIDVLHKRYKKIDAFNKVWEKSFKTWEELDKAGAIRPPVVAEGKWAQNQEVVRQSKRGDKQDAALLADCDAFLEQLSDRYFRITAAAIKAADPNHMVLGCRFAYVPARVVVAASAKYLDCISLNSYHMDPREIIDAYSVFDKPLIISEFSFKAEDSGLPNTRGAGPVLKTQTERTKGFKDYITWSLSNPAFVGYHWYKFGDDPKESQGENSNFGFVNVNDEPYAELVAGMTTINRTADSLHGMHYAVLHSSISQAGPFYTKDFDSLSLPNNIKVEVKNTSDRTMSGRFHLESILNPVKAWRYYQGGGRIPDLSVYDISKCLWYDSQVNTNYHLKPGEKKSWTIACRTLPGIHTVTLKAVLPGYYDRVFPLTMDVRGRFPIQRGPSLADLANVKNMLDRHNALLIRSGQTTVAEIVLGIAGNNLALHAVVLDKSVNPGNKNWAGDLELFFSLPERNFVHQVMFVAKPDKANNEVWLFKKGAKEAAPTIRWESILRSDYGYEITALIPLDLIQVNPDKPFLAEAAVVAADTENGKQLYTTLFRSESAFQNDELFSLFEPKR